MITKILRFLPHLSSVYIISYQFNKRDNCTSFFDDWKHQLIFQPNYRIHCLPAVAANIKDNYVNSDDNSSNNENNAILKNIEDFCKHLGFENVVFPKIIKKKDNVHKLYLTFTHGEDSSCDQIKTSPQVQVELCSDQTQLTEQEIQALKMILYTTYCKKKNMNEMIHHPYGYNENFPSKNSLLSFFFGDNMTSHSDFESLIDSFFESDGMVFPLSSGLESNSFSESLPKHHSSCTIYKSTMNNHHLGLHPPNLNSNESECNTSSVIKKQLESMGAQVFLPNDSRQELDWSELAGYDEPKRIIEETLMLSLEQPALFNQITKITRGKQGESNRPRLILFNGPPGTGKTSTARIISNIVKLPLIYVSLESIVSKWYGESEKNLGKIFDYAKHLGELHGGCVIFVDEIDSLALSRDDVTLHEASRRMLSILLRRLDGFDTQTDKTVLICATNREKDLDEAFRSRVDVTVMFPLPNLKGRELIIKRYAKHLNHDEITQLASICEGLSGRNIKDFCQIAERRWIAYLLKNKNTIQNNQQTHNLGDSTNSIDTLSGPPIQYYLTSAHEKMQQQI